MARPSTPETNESPALVEEQSPPADPTVVTAHEASPRISSEANGSGCQPRHASDSSIHSQGTTDTFGLSATKSMRGVPRRRGPRPKPHDCEPPGSGASITSISHQHTGSHGTNRSLGQNDGYALAVDYVFGPPPPVLEQPELDTSSGSHVTVPVPRRLSPNVGPIELITPASHLPPLTPFLQRISIRPSPVEPVSHQRCLVEPLVPGRDQQDKAWVSSAFHAIVPPQHAQFSLPLQSPLEAIPRTNLHRSLRPLSPHRTPNHPLSLPTTRPVAPSRKWTLRYPTIVFWICTRKDPPPRSNAPLSDSSSLLSNGHQSHPS